MSSRFAASTTSARSRNSAAASAERALDELVLSSGSAAAASRASRSSCSRIAVIPQESRARVRSLAPRRPRRARAAPSRSTTAPGSRGSPRARAAPRRSDRRRARQATSRAAGGYVARPSVAICRLCRRPLEPVERAAGAVELAGARASVEDGLERGEPARARVAQPERREAFLDVRDERLAQAAARDLEWRAAPITRA